MENEKTTDKPVVNTADKVSEKSTAESAGKPTGKPAATAEKPAAEPSEKPAAKSLETPAAKTAEGAAGKSSGRRRTRQTGRPEDRPEGQRSDRRDGQQSGRQSAERPRQQNGQQNGRQSTPQNGQQSGRRNGQQNTRQDARTDRQNDRPNDRQTDRQNGRQGARPESRRTERTARTAEKSAAKKPFSAWTWREYALQLSVVVIGIVVTFAGSGLIERWSRQRQLKMTMQLVVDELTTNRNALSEVCGQLEYDRQGMLMFTAYDRLEDIPADSLSRYGLILSILPSYRPQQEALEVLRSSDMISTVGDKKFLADIFGCYNRLTDFRENVGLYASRKQDAQNHLFMNSPGFSLDPMGSPNSWKTIMADPMCAAFIGTSAYFFGGSDYFRRTLQEVDAVVAAIRAKYGVE